MLIDLCALFWDEPAELACAVKCKVVAERIGWVRVTSAVRKGEHLPLFS